MHPLSRGGRGRYAALAAAAIAACQQPERAPGTGASPDEPPPPPYNEQTVPIDSVPAPAPGTSPDRPEQTIRVIRIEGAPDTIRVRLARAPDDFTVPFSTYVPEDMSVRFERSEAGESFRAAAEFGGTASPDAYVQLLIYPAGAPLASVRNSVQGFLTSLNPEAEGFEPADRFEWSDEEFAFRYPEAAAGGSMRVGVISIGRHGNRFFHLLIHYPAEYGDGMAPRTALILDEWRWEDTGGGLSPT